MGLHMTMTIRSRSNLALQGVLKVYFVSSAESFQLCWAYVTRCHPSVRQSVSQSVCKQAQIITTGDIKLKSEVGCPQVTLTPPARN